MASTHQPQNAPIDLVRQAVQEAMQNESISIDNFPAIQQVSGSVQAAPSTSSIITTRAPGYTVPATPGTAVPLTVLSTLVDSVFMRASKNTGLPNTAILFLGSTTNQTIPLEPGSGYSEIAPAGKKLDLSLIYVKVQTAGDAVSWIASN